MFTTLFDKVAQKFHSADLLGLNSFIPNLMRNAEVFEAKTQQLDSTEAMMQVENNETAQRKFFLEKSIKEKAEKAKELFQEMLTAKRELKKAVGTRQIESKQALYDTAHKAWAQTRQKVERATKALEMIQTAEAKTFITGTHTKPLMAEVADTTVADTRRELSSAIDAPFAKMEANLKADLQETASTSNAKTQPIALSEIAIKENNVELPEVNIAIPETEAKVKTPKLSLKEKLAGFGKKMFEKRKNVIKSVRQATTKIVPNFKLKAKQVEEKIEEIGFFNSLRQSPAFKGAALGALLSFATPAFAGSTNIGQTGAKKFGTEISDIASSVEFGPASVQAGELQGTGIPVQQELITEDLLQYFQSIETGFDTMSKNKCDLKAFTLRTKTQTEALKTAAWSIQELAYGLFTKAEVHQAISDPNSDFRKALIDTTGCGVGADTNFTKNLSYLTGHYKGDVAKFIEHTGYGNGKVILTAYIQWRLNQAGANLKIDGRFGETTCQLTKEYTTSLLESQKQEAPKEQIKLQKSEAPEEQINPQKPESPEEPNDQCSVGDCSLSPEEPSYLNLNNTYQISLSTEKQDLSTETQAYLTETQAFISQIDKLSLGDLVNQIGCKNLQADRTFASNSSETKKRDSIQKLSETPNKASLKEVKALSQITTKRNQAIASRIETIIKHGEIPAPNSIEGKNFYALINYIVADLGLSQIKIPRNILHILKLDQEDGNILKFKTSTEASYVKFLMKAIQDKEAELKHSAPDDPFLDRDERELRKMKRTLRKTMRKMHKEYEQRDYLMTLNEIKIFSDLGDQHILGNNVFSTLFPTVDFTTDFGKFIDSTLFIIPRTVFSLIEYGKNIVTNETVQNTPAFEIPYQTCSGNKFDTPMDQRYNQVTTNAGKKLPATEILNNETGLGVFGREAGFQTTADEHVTLQDKNRPQALLAAIWSPETLQNNPNFIKQVALYASNIDYQALFGHLDPSIPDFDLDLIAKKNFEKVGQDLIRLYNGDVECAWRAYCAIVKLVLNKVPADADLAEVPLNQCVSLGERNDGMQTGLIHEIIKRLHSHHSRKHESASATTEGPAENLIPANTTPATLTGTSNPVIIGSDIYL